MVSVNKVQQPRLQLQIFQNWENWKKKPFSCFVVGCDDESGNFCIVEVGAKSFEMVELGFIRKSKKAWEPIWVLM